MNKNFIYRPVCEVCGSKENKIIFTRAFTDPSVWNFLERYYENRIPIDLFENVDYEIKKCPDCEFIWQSYILNNELLGELYENWISKEQSLDKSNSYSDVDESSLRRQMFVIKKLLNKKDINVLDYGMGWGKWCMAAKNYGFNVFGYEISEERTSFAKNNGINVINDYKKIKDHKFDFINSEQVFEHINNPAETLNYLFTALNPGGYIRISVPNGRNIEKEFKNSNWTAGKNALHPLEHINCFNYQSLRKLGQLSGLKYIKQPILIENNTLVDLIKGKLGSMLRQYSGTCLYFKFGE
ncbi:hypothetical protein A2483_00850 [Candidatus Peregrinibacteria bacterium RIFOXYC2_FULL_33_13]|nr:MAG: Methyltransferase domain protein [Candidatus Peregrinibacteria bacterium GW2011_GWA2_33_10]KKP38477.1 MAG: methyltransferase [Candidatus Peregrinibacteria bacterium GW2011_GWC2_33_13]OGJ56036.1 MAG: hypothetical protein A2483_00850 [Candidatus Peregrinibacteria bacterium RIFOXYC2_FULL_33_13]